jgi:hypothetical protein
MRLIIGIVFAMLAIIIGFFGLTLFFSDGTPSMVQRLAIAGVVYFVFGLLTGYFNPQIWLLAGLAAWGPVFLGVQGIASHGGGAVEAIPSFLGVAGLPLAAALIGAYLGSLPRRR